MLVVAWIEILPLQHEALHQDLQLNRVELDILQEEMHQAHLQRQLEQVDLQVEVEVPVDLQAKAAVVEAAEAVAAAAAVGVVLKWFIMEYGKKLNNSLV